jgi:hypothetical protein
MHGGIMPPVRSPLPGIVLERLAWLRDEVGPLLGRALRRSGGIPLRPLMTQALLMGDEMHQRNVAASFLLARARLPALCEDAGAPGLGRLAAFVCGNGKFTLLINTGIAGRRAGTGQVGAGTVRAPLGCFTRALEALARSRGAA